MPYSDNLYSAWDDDESDTEPTVSDGLNHPGSSLRGDTSHALGTGGDDELEDALSPTDGYFQSSSSTASALEPGSSSNAPRVPNVWVHDPSLASNSTAESKAQEAARERTTNPQHASQPLRQSPPSTTSPTIYRHPEPTSPLSFPPPDAYHQQSSPRHAPSGPWPTASYTPYSPHRLAYGPGPSSIPAEAPPAYTPSPTTSSPTGSGNVSTNYSTFSPAHPAPNTTAPMGGQDESQGLLSREPQSMGDPDVEPQDGSLPWHDRARRKLTARGIGKSIAVAGLLLFIICSFLGAALDAGQDQDRSYPPRKKPVQKDPVFDPPTDSPPMETPGLSPNFPWSDRSCKRAQISRDTRDFDIAFTADNPLTITQNVSQSEHHGPPIGIQGSVVLRQAYGDSPGPSVVIETVVNDPSLDVSIHWDAPSQSLVVAVPHDTPWDDPSSRPCLSVLVTVHVPESSTLATLTINTMHLDISLLDNLSLSILSATTLTSTVGSITSASTGYSPALNQTLPPSSFAFLSPSISASTISGPIHGAWPLPASLSLLSISGAISVLVSPSPATLNNSPAALTVSTTSGSIDIRSPIHAAAQAVALSRYLGAPGVAGRAEQLLPPREYRVTVRSQSGAIRAAVPFSSAADFRTTSGRMEVELLPVLQADGEGVVSTKSVSGRTRVVVCEPLWVGSGDGGYEMGGKALRRLSGEFTATSGGVGVVFPGSWEGRVELKAVAAKVGVRGRGVEVLKRWRGEVVARKGEDGGGRIRGEVVSGGVDVLIGEEV